MSSVSARKIGKNGPFLPPPPPLRSTIKRQEAGRASAITAAGTPTAISFFSYKGGKRSLSFSLRYDKGVHETNLFLNNNKTVHLSHPLRSMLNVIFTFLPTPSPPISSFSSPSVVKDSNEAV